MSKSKPATPGEVLAALGPVKMVVLKTRQKGCSWASVAQHVSASKSPRPDWLDEMRRPIRVMAATELQFSMFRTVWRFAPHEMRRVQEMQHIAGVSTYAPLLILPGGAQEGSFEALRPCRYFLNRGGRVIDIPEINVLGEPFSAGFNMVAETICELCKANR